MLAPIAAKAASSWGPALIGGIGNAIGGLFGMSGQSSANQANLQIARENREWQERMSSTAYQRATKDLEASGLNRILALGSPASTPAGNVATMQNVKAPAQEGISRGINTALQAKLQAAQINEINARARLTDAQRRALTPAAQLGEGVGTALDYAGKRLSPRQIDYGSIWKTTQDLAKQNIDKIANSVGLAPDKARRELIKVMEEMDLPKMSITEMYQWALDNPEKIKLYLMRTRRGFPQ